MSGEIGNSVVLLIAAYDDAVGAMTINMVHFCNEVETY